MLCTLCLTINKIFLHYYYNYNIIDIELMGGGLKIYVLKLFPKRASVPTFLMRIVDDTEIYFRILENSSKFSFLTSYLCS